MGVSKRSSHIIIIILKDPKKLYFPTAFDFQIPRRRRYRREYFEILASGNRQRAQPIGNPREFDERIAIKDGKSERKNSVSYQCRFTFAEDKLNCSSDNRFEARL
jgi:hypothetical protein